MSERKLIVSFYKKKGLSININNAHVLIAEISFRKYHYKLTYY